MRSGLESYLVEVLYKTRLLIATRDRAVLVGAALSFVPIFPSCLLGVLLSLMNWVLIAMGRTAPQELRLVHVSLVVGVCNLILSIYLLASLGGGLVWLLETCANFVSVVLFQLGIIPTPHLLPRALSA